MINILENMRCDVLAQGVVEAAKQVNLSVPLVVRLRVLIIKKERKF